MASRLDSVSATRKSFSKKKAGAMAELNQQSRAKRSRASTMPPLTDAMQGRWPRMRR